MIAKVVNAYNLIKGRGIRPLLNLIQARTQFISRSEFSSALPSSLFIEPTNACNLRCPTCVTGAGKMKREVMFFPLDIYKKIIDEVKDVLINLTLHNYGEPLLHKQICQMIRYAAKYGIDVRLSTNAHFFTDQSFCEELLLAGLRDLKICLDGADHETYEKFRVGGEFEKVVEGTRSVVKIKRKLGLRYPIIGIQCILNRYNLGQLKEIKSIAMDTGVDLFEVKSMHICPLDPDFERIATEFLPEDERFARFEKGSDGNFVLKYHIPRGCLWVYETMVINSDGSVTACCYDMYDHINLGNVFKQTSIRKIWNGAEYRRLRYTLWRSKASIAPCRFCPEGREF